MKKLFLSRVFTSLLLLWLGLIQINVHAEGLSLNTPETALKTYVEYNDGMFNMQHIASIPASGYSVHLYRLTSQKWLTEAEVNQPVWTHSVVIVIPNTVATTTGMLFVAGDDNDDPLPDASNEVVQIVAQLALGSQSIVSAIFQAPNQPLLFNGETNPVKEDALVAYTWKKALDTGNYIWPAYLPMVKSVVKAMDGIQQVVPTLSNYAINDFVLTGYSKRGATVYLTAAVDDRVRAMAPGVIDYLNMIPSMEHHYQSYGFFSSAIDDYVELGVTSRLRAPEFSELMKVVDPYSYKQQYTMEKLLLNSSGDQFFLPDSSRFYLDDLPGETLIRYAPNTDHSLSNSQTSVLDTLYSLLGWYQSILYGQPRPDINWYVENGVLKASTNALPALVKIWRANNPNARDFRKETIGESWVPTVVIPNAGGNYEAALQTEGGFNAVYIEFIYLGMTGQPVSYSTEIMVTPDIYPYALTQPVNDPQPASFWKHEVASALKNKAATIEIDTLKSYLPIPVFDIIASTLDDALDMLKIRFGWNDGKLSTTPLQAVAQRECLSTRFNIQHGEIGWYSDVDLWWFGNKPLWQHYAQAHQAALNNHPGEAMMICMMINQL
ncbi:MAG: PhoPQ-activated pathogenicity [Gammaproteobacteria bacterium]|nr:MAG: PhoPQ-activated pathogenicity [Gammaproteobacteria bacterium]